MVNPVEPYGPIWFKNHASKLKLSVFVFHFIFKTCFTVMGYQFCFAINIFNTYKIQYFLWDNFSSHDNHSSALVFFFFFFLNKKKSTFLWDNHPLFLMFIKYFFCEIVYLYMIVGFLLSKILPPLSLLVFKFKLNYKFIQSTIFIFIF